MKREKLSENFWLHELLFSETASRLGREIEPSEMEKENLKRLCVEVLEPVRTHLGDRVITISSGLRPLWLNKAVGGSRTSEHVFGRAADFRVLGLSPYDVTAELALFIRTLPVNQLILEFDTWTHISICEKSSIPKREVLTARKVDGKTHYLPGAQRSAA